MINQLWTDGKCQRIEILEEREREVRYSLGWVDRRMVTVAYENISPTALMLYMENLGEFTMKYLTQVRAPKLQQTKPMAVGSAFDAIVKEYIRVNLGLPVGGDLWAQVEVPGMEGIGKMIFEKYKASGALADLMLEIDRAGDLRYEFDLKGNTPKGVPIQGKPDLAWGNRIIDWKVNGFLSNASPKPGYVLDRSTGKCHKDAIVVQGINVAGKIDRSWGIQLRTYGWLLGLGEFIGGIEQLVGPSVRCCSFRYRIGEDEELEKKYEACYDYIVNYTGNPEYEKLARALWPTGNDREDWFTRISR